MTIPNDGPEVAAALRQRAEARAQEKSGAVPENSGDLSAAETQQLLHELRVHQIELELQNEELRRTQQELQLARDQYQQLYDFAPIGYVTLSEQGMILQANLSASLLLGVDRTRLLQQPFSNFIFRTDQDRYYHHWRHLFATQEAQTCEVRMVRLDGAQFWARIEAVAIAGDDAQRVCRAVISDITAHKQAEATLRDSETQYRNLADSGLALIWTSNPEKLCTYFNQPWLQFTGRTLEQEWGNGWTEGVHPDDFAQCLQIYVTAFDKRTPFDMEYRLRHVSGEYRWIRDLGTPNYNSDGEFRGYIGHCFDITERKQADVQLQAYADHLAQLVDEKVQQLEQERIKVIQAAKLSALGEMATGVAHEINQPLTSLLLDAEYVEVLAQRVLAGEMEQCMVPNEMLEIAGNQVRDIERCRRIIDHLRTFGRISHEPVAPLTLNAVLDDTFILLEQRLRHHDVTVTQDLAADLPPVLAHPQKLEQVFLNLISNAEYALAEMERRAQEGEVERPGYEKTLHIRSYTEGARVCLAIHDNGCGMSPEQQTHLFEPFFTTKPVGQGTGLGLSISYGIVTEFGGEITCESAVNEGTMFTVCLPVAGNE